MASSPTVLSPLTLPALFSYILTTQSATASTTLIICSSREAFLEHLSHPLQPRLGLATDNLQALTAPTAPTLHNLLTARPIRVAFCASVQALLAYLTAHGRAAAKKSGIGEREGEERLVLVNPLSLHAPTPSFSAQGLSRTFAIAVETAMRLKTRLLMVECVRGAPESRYREVHEQVDALMQSGDGGDQAEVEEEDPWEQDVSILNVSARKFGSGSSDRAWAGRTIKVKRIAGRWFRFYKVDDFHEEDTRE